MAGLFLLYGVSLVQPLGLEVEAAFKIIKYVPI
jgi:hypothetical protein